MSEKKLQPIVECYNVDEEYLYNKTYLYIAGFAAGRNFKYTPKALPLARKLHDGQYRKGLVEVNGQMVKLPYVLHVLKVCGTLISLNIPMSDEDLDILCTCALLHDTLEDAEEYFPQGGVEYERDYGFPAIVGQTIKLLSKHTGADEYELNAYFNAIKVNKFALLVKMADRSHNVEDLYNMKNIPKYIKETQDYFLSKNGICAYGRQNYPEFSNAITVLKAKILSLTEATEALMHRQEELLKEKDDKIAELERRLRELTAHQQN
jgi:GTP pyrophosphokinase